MLLLQLLPIILVFDAFLPCNLVSSMQQTVTIEIAAKKENNLVIAARKAVEDLNSLKTNVIFKADWFDISNIREDLSLYGNQLLQRNASIVFHASIPEKLTFLILNVLNIPLVGVWHQGCSKCLQGTLAGYNHGSLMPNQKDQGDIVNKFVLRLDWKIIGIMYEGGEISTALEVAKEMRQRQITVYFGALRSQNGTISPYSDREITDIYNAKPDGIIVFIDEARLNRFFDYVNSDSLQFNMLKTTFLIYNLIESSHLVADRLNTIVALYPDIKDDVKVQSLTSQFNKSEYEGKDAGIYALMYDAVMISGTIISDLIAKNQWNKTEGNFLENGKQRGKRSVAFIKALQEFHGTGITGNIQFDAHSVRKRMPIKIMNLQKNYFTQIGTSDKNGLLKLQSEPKLNFEQGDQLKINGTLKVVTLMDDPFVTKKTLPNGTVVYGGILVDILKEMSVIANFTFTIYEAADGAYGHIVDGKWVGMVGDVLYKKADLALGAITVTSAREAIVYFTKSYVEVKVGIVSQRPKPAMLDLMQFMTPFTTTVWMLILTACVGVGIMLFTVDYFSPFGWRQYRERKSDEAGKELNLGNSIWFSIQSILLQGADNTPRSLSGRVLVGCFWFYVLILTSSYTANLAAFFTSTKASEDDSSLESMLKSGRKFTTVANYALEQYLNISDYKVYNRIHEQMVLQNNLANGSQDAFRRVRSNSEVYYLEEIPFIQWHVEKAPCDLQIDSTTIPETAWGLPVAKDSQYASALSYAIMRMMESGFIKQVQRSYEKKFFQCGSSIDHSSHGITHDGRIEPLQMLGVYAFLFGGIIISVLVMITENWWKKKVEERAARVKSRFGQSIRKFRARSTFRNNRLVSVKPMTSQNAMRLVVTDLMKEKNVFGTE